MVGWLAGWLAGWAGGWLAGGLGGEDWVSREWGDWVGCASVRRAGIVGEGIAGSAGVILWNLDR